MLLNGQFIRIFAAWVVLFVGLGVR